MESINFKLIKLDLKSNTKTILAEKSTENLNTGDKRIKYPDSYFDLKDAVLSDYSNNNDLNYFLKGGSIVWNKGFTGSLNVEASDFLKYYKIKFNTDFLRYNKDNNMNHYLEYNYLKYRIDFGAEVFYKTKSAHS